MRVDEHTITLDQAPYFYRSAPSSGAPVLYLHGVPTSSDDWAPFLERTGGIAPDLPGFGRSSKGGHLDYSPAGHASFIERLLDALGADRVKLVAHDWGAVGGLLFAQRHPDRVERIVLLDAVPLLDGLRWHGLARLWRRPVLGELAMGSTRRWLLVRACAAAAFAPMRGRPSASRLCGSNSTRARSARSCACIARATSGGSPSSAPTSIALHAPTLVIWGERDPWLEPALADAYAARIPGAQAERIAGAGHWPWLDQPSVIDRVAAFLEGP